MQEKTMVYIIGFTKSTKPKIPQVWNIDLILLLT